MEDNIFTSALQAREYNQIQENEMNNKNKKQKEYKKATEDIINCLNIQIANQNKNIEILKKENKTQKKVNIVTISLSVLAILVSIIISIFEFAFK